MFSYRSREALERSKLIIKWGRGQIEFKDGTTYTGANKKTTLQYLEKTFTAVQLERILDLACRRLKEDYSNAPEDKTDGKLWFELFYQHCAGYKGERSVAEVRKLDMD